MKTPQQFTKTINARISEKLARRCGAAAKAERRPLSQWLRMVLEKATQK